MSGGDALDEAVERLKLVVFVVIAVVGAGGSLTLRELSKRARCRRWRVRRALKRLLAQGVVEQNGNAFSLTEHGRRLAPVALSALALKGFEGDLRPQLLADEEQGASRGYGHGPEP
jgi:DNA-binding MarR family transcriptional regulator